MFPMNDFCFRKRFSTPSVIAGGLICVAFLLYSMPSLKQPAAHICISRCENLDSLDNMQRTRFKSHHQVNIPEYFSIISDEVPHGPFPEYWPAAAQKLYSDINKTLADYFPEDLAGSYVSVHFSRFVHTMWRLQLSTKPGKRFLCIGDRVHFPLLIHRFLHASKVEITNLPGDVGEESNKLVAKASNDALPPYKLEFIANDIETQRLPHKDNTVDYITNFEVVEHFRLDPSTALNEMNRVLKKGGKLFLSTPNIASFTALCELMDGNTPYLFSRYFWNKGPTHLREYAWQELGEILRTAGFKVTFANFSPYADKTDWDFEKNQPTPRCAALAQSIDGREQSLWGTNNFLIAEKIGKPIAARYEPLYYSD